MEIKMLDAKLKGNEKTLKEKEYTLSTTINTGE